MSAQRVLIVGGSSGIGLATAGLLAKQGFDVTIAGRDNTRLQEAKAILRHEVHVTQLDASKTTALPDAFRSIGPIDHLVLALGSGKGGGPFANVGIEALRQGLEEKVLSHFACAQAALGTLSPQGSITFISAVSAQAALPGTAGLGAANAAVAALVPTLAAELRPLRVNAVSPGVIDTPWWDQLPAEQKAAAFAMYAKQSAVGRIGRPEDIAQVIGLLVTNSFMTGQTVICDGGLSLGVQA